LQQKPRAILQAADGRQPHASPKKIPFFQAFCAWRVGWPLACATELIAISNSDPGDPAIPRTKSVAYRLDDPTHSANRGKEPFPTLPTGFSNGIYCSAHPSGATGRISEPCPASGRPRIATHSARCRTRRTTDPYCEAKQQEGSLADRLKSEQELQAKGLTTQSTVITARDSLFSVQHQISDNQVRLTEIISEKVKIARETQEKRNTRKKEIDDTLRQLHEYETQRDWSTKVLSPYRGRVLEKLVERGNLVSSKDRIVTIETNEGAMQAVLFIPAGDGKKVSVGMQVQISPSTVKPEEFGFMLGQVKSVSLFPSTPEGMQRVLRNDQLVKELAQRGSPIEVVTDLLLDPTTRSGFKWSSPQGPPLGIFSGTLCTGSIVVDRKRPVEYVIPKIKETFGIQ
jgi:hypothetical protein